MSDVTITLNEAEQAALLARQLDLLDVDSVTGKILAAQAGRPESWREYRID
jgi:hypothetical protein